MSHFVVLNRMFNPFYAYNFVMFHIYNRYPYIIHLYEVAKILAGLGMGAKTISAGLLHDCIDDVGVTSEQLIEKFGDEINH